MKRWVYRRPPDFRPSIRRILPEVPGVTGQVYNETPNASFALSLEAIDQIVGADNVTESVVLSLSPKEQSLVVESLSQEIVFLPTETEQLFLSGDVSLSLVLIFAETGQTSGTDSVIKTLVFDNTSTEVLSFPEVLQETFVLLPSVSDNFGAQVFNENPGLTLVFASSGVDSRVSTENQTVSCGSVISIADPATFDGTSEVSGLLSPIPLDLALLSDDKSEAVVVLGSGTDQSSVTETTLVTEIFVGSVGDNLVKGVIEETLLVALQIQTSSPEIVVGSESQMVSVLHQIFGQDSSVSNDVASVIALATHSVVDAGLLVDVDSLSMAFPVSSADVRVLTELISATSSVLPTTQDSAFFSDEPSTTEIISHAPLDFALLIDFLSITEIFNILEVDTTGAGVVENPSVTSVVLVFVSDQLVGKDTQTTVYTVFVSPADAGTFSDPLSVSGAATSTVTDVAVLFDTTLVSKIFAFALQDPVILVDSRDATEIFDSTLRDFALLGDSQSLTEVFIPSVTDVVGGRVFDETLTVSLVLSESKTETLIGQESQQASVFALVNQTDAAFFSDPTTSTESFVSTPLDLARLFDVLALTEVYIPSTTDSIGGRVLDETLSASIIFASSEADTFIPGAITESVSTSFVFDLTLTRDQPVYADSPSASSGSAVGVDEVEVAADSSAREFVLIGAISESFIPLAGGISGFRVIVPSKDLKSQVTDRPKTDVSGRQFTTNPPGKGLLV